MLYQAGGACKASTGRMTEGKVRGSLLVATLVPLTIALSVQGLHAHRMKVPLWNPILRFKEQRFTIGWGCWGNTSWMQNGA